jgi:hypothetical protein
MSRHGKIDWKRLRYAAKETALIMLCGVIMIAMIGVPVFLCLLTNTSWFLLLYPLIFFVVETWENYNGN